MDSSRYMASAVAAVDMDEEYSTLDAEFRWLLENEVPAVLKQLYQLLDECFQKYFKDSGTDTQAMKPSKFILSSTNCTDNIKGVVTVFQDCVLSADIVLRLSRNPHHGLKVAIKDGSPWELNQMKDAENHLCLAIDSVSSKDDDFQFTSGREIIQFADTIIDHLSRAKKCLTNPKRRSVDEMYRAKHRKLFQPQLPADTVLNFYIQCNKLVLAAHQLHTPHTQKSTSGGVTGSGRNEHSPQYGKSGENGVRRYEVVSQQFAECLLPSLTDMLICLSLALQLCQQLKDKIIVFNQYGIGGW